MQEVELTDPTFFPEFVQPPTSQWTLVGTVEQPIFSAAVPSALPLPDLRGDASKLEIEGTSGGNAAQFTNVVKPGHYAVVSHKKAGIGPDSTRTWLGRHKSPIDDDVSTRHVGTAHFQLPLRQAVSGSADLERYAARHAVVRRLKHTDSEWVLTTANAALNRGVCEEVCHAGYYTNEHYARQGDVHPQTKSKDGQRVGTWVRWCQSELDLEYDRP
jgi:hypothetical protein